MQLSATTVNYQTAGSWQPIDNKLVADPTQSGGFVNSGNSWHVHFGTTAQGVTVETASAGSLAIGPVGAALVAPVVTGDGTQVTYANAWPGADLVYTVTGSAVQESVEIKSASAGSSFTFAVRSGTEAQVIAAGKTPAAHDSTSFTKATDGTLTPTGALSNQVQLVQPEVLRTDGSPDTTAGAALSTAPGQVVLSVDSTWLAAQPSSAFPINLDPSLGVGPDNWADYMNTGPTCGGSACGVRGGNSRAGGDTIWRSVIHFPYESLFGDTVLAVAVTGSRTAGTANSYGIGAYYANAFSFGGASGNNVPLASAGTGNNVFTLSSSSLTSTVASWINARSSGQNLGFLGAETPGVYTFQQWNSAMGITYDRPPSVATAVSPPSPANGAHVHAFSVTLGATATDPDGDPLTYYFRIAENSDAETNQVFNSGWSGSSTATFTIPSALFNTVLYWHAYSDDGYVMTVPNWVDSFEVTDSPPAAASQTGASPANTAIVSSTTPVLSVPPATDPDGDTVMYDFTVTGSGTDTSGQATSGWQTATSWPVPLGVLADGQSYQWSVQTADGTLTSPGMVTSPGFVNTFTVNERLGATTVSPTDTLAGASVNLANGNATVSVASHTVTTVGGPLGVTMTYNSQASTRNGLLGQYYADNDRAWNFATAGSPLLVRTDPSLNLFWAQGTYPASPPGLPTTQYIVRWTGYVTLPTTSPSGTPYPTGSYQLGVESDDGARIYWNNNTTTPIYNDWGGFHAAQPAPAWSTGVPLTPGVPVPVEVDYMNQGGPGQMSLFVQGDDSNTSPAVPSQLVPAPWLSPGLSALPAGWTLSLPGGGGSYTHAAVGPNSVVLTDGSGTAHTYLLTSDGGYTPPPGEDGVLFKDSAGGLTLNDSDGSVYTFDALGDPLTATSPSDTLHPAAATYAYNTTITPPQVTAITDPVSGQSIHLYYGTDSHCGTPPSNYDTTVAPNLLCQVAFWDSKVTSVYYKNGLLAAVVNPGTEVMQFGYTTGLLTSIASPLDVDWQQAGTGRTMPVTAIGYTWVAAASGSAVGNIRPAFTTVSQTAPPAGSVPLVTSLIGPPPDGVTTAQEPADTYTYTSTNETQLHVAGLSTTIDRDVTYDTAGRLLTNVTATGQTSSTAWDSTGHDQPVSSTDAAGRVTTTIYDWAMRVTDRYGPAPASCFQTTGTYAGFPVSSPPPSCGVIPHSHTGIDTTTSGVRISGLQASTWSNINESGPPATRLTATPGGLASSAGQSQQFTGELALAPGSYTFSAGVGDTTNDGVRVYVDGAPVLDRWTTERQAILGDGPADYWRLGDTAGSSTAANQVSGGAAATATSVTFGATGPGPVDPATAATFNGSTSKLSLPSASAPVGTGSITVEAWIKPTSNTVWGNIVTKLASAGYVDPYDLRLNSSGHLEFIQGDGSTWNNDLVAPAPVAAGQWSYVAATRTNLGVVTLYVNGVAVASSTMNTSIPSDTAPVDIGNREDHAIPFAGSIADVAINPNALSNTQVVNHYQAGVATLGPLTGTGSTTFTAATLNVAPGTLPAAPASQPHTIRIDYRNPSATANVTIKATPSGGSATTIPASAFDPRYGLATYSTTDDAGGLPSGTETTATSYSGGGLDPVYGLATDSIVDPAGLNLDTQTAYELPGGSGYLRETAKALPSANINTTAQTHTISYYSATQSVTNPCPSGTAANQAGLPDVTTEPTPGTGSAVSSQAVYDSTGRVVATRNPGDGSSGWTCTTYDSRGRVTSVSVPTVNGHPARTVTTSYAVGGNPLVTSVVDGTGTTTTTTDLLGRTVSYTDTTGTTTATTYDQPGRDVSDATTASGGGTSTITTAYLDDGRVSSVSLDGKVVAAPSYDTYGQLTGVSYPTGTGDGGNGTSLSSITRNPQGNETAIAWSLPGPHTVTDTVTLSQADRVTQDTATQDSATTAQWTYGYDNAGRLTTAGLAAAGSRPAVSLGYGFAASGGCGADASAGKDSARTSQSVTTGTGSPQVTTSCADYGSRITSATGTSVVPAAQLTYDNHGNMTQLGNQTFSYDASDRVVGTTITGTGTSQTIAYVLDSAGRMVTRTTSGTGTGAENDSATYAYTEARDSPGLQLTSGKQIGERYLSLPGGALLIKRYTFTAADDWAYPNLHGDNIVTAGPSGTITGSGFLYDPFGQPLSTTTSQVSPTAAPNTRNDGPTDAFEGQHQRGYENANGANYTLMGARIYLPAWGQFTALDPVFGGNANPYAYPADPIDQMDLTGNCWWSWACKHAKVIALTALVVVSVAAVVATGGTALILAGAVEEGTAAAFAVSASVTTADAVAAAGSAIACGNDFNSGGSATAKAVDCGGVVLGGGGAIADTAARVSKAATVGAHAAGAARAAKAASAATAAGLSVALGGDAFTAWSFDVWFAERKNE